ncbi:A disintegrin and metalloproteinase with thrombospondin motifs 20-like [Haliotis rufescens]|uniref:A disintegrin and metalloproteinase with thrombospondin motifs 20-like n=1 Tax=Haliotis rufescens TaxID=6454 RepID=UPI001EAFA92A|nr:A disintegrin and metalloproteinase with thrombospondin motifs 20-like [Haliotis rufescens]
MDLWTILHLMITIAISYISCSEQHCGVFILFRRRGYASADTVSTYESLVDRFHNVSMLECADRVYTKYNWFIYGAKSRTCTGSKCLFLPVTLSETPSDYIIYHRDQPHMCEDIKTRDPTAGDGEYVLYPTAASMHGCPTKIYCSNMASGSPLEFVTLPTLNEGNYPEVHTMNCTEEIPYLSGFGVGSEGNYLYSKIRIHVKNMTIKADDFTFVNVVMGNTYPYGTASDCYTYQATCGPKGTFHINTLGTGMLVDKQLNWILHDFSHKGKLRVARSPGGEKIELLCGGFCGGCVPDGPIVLYPNTEDAAFLGNIGSSLTREKSIE